MPFLPEPGLTQAEHDALDAAGHGSGAATDGQVLTADGAGGAAWEAIPAGGGGGSGEVLMQDGVSNPPQPLTTEDGTDWLYEG